MSAPSQDYSAAITWTSDWTAHLAANGGLTITAQTVTVPVQPAGGTVTISGQTIAAGSKGVTFKVTQTGLTAPAVATVVVGVTLSNGDTDQRNFLIQFTDT